MSIPDASETPKWGGRGRVSVARLTPSIQTRNRHRVSARGEVSSRGSSHLQGNKDRDGHRAVAGRERRAAEERNSGACGSRELKGLCREGPAPPEENSEKSGHAIA